MRKNDLVLLSTKKMEQKERDAFAVLLGSFGYINQRFRQYAKNGRVVTVIPNRGEPFTYDQIHTMIDFLNRPPN